MSPDSYWQKSEADRIVAMQQASGFTQAEVEKRYRQYVEDHHGDVTDLPRICEVMWNAGGRAAIAAMVGVGDIMPTLGRIESRVVHLRAMMESLQREGR